jgi:hypothetical protein
VRREKHVVSLYGGADEEARKGNDRKAEAFDEILIDERLMMLGRNTRQEEGDYICVVVLCQDVEVALIHGWLDTVKFADVCVLDPVYQHFASNNEEEWRKDFTGPAGENGETIWK